MKKVMREHFLDRFGGADNLTMNPPLPTSLNIELNNTCNQKCVFCRFHGKHSKQGGITPAVMDFDFAQKIMNQAVECGIGSKEIGFYLAGEAFMYKRFEDIVSYAKQLGFPYVFLTTNGALANPDRMKTVIDAGIDSVRFSVNAADRETYAKLHGADDFDKVLDNIKFLYEYREKTHKNIAISLSCVLTYKTLDIKADMEKIFGKYVDDILFIPVQLVGLENCDYLEDEIRLLDFSQAQKRKDWVCPILFNTMYISADGYVIPCCNAYDYDVKFWNLKEKFDMEGAWNCEAYRRYRAIFLENESDRGTICSSCVSRLDGIRYRVDGLAEYKSISEGFSL